MTNEQTPFVDLPAALVEEVIEQTAVVGDMLLETFRKIKSDQDQYRRRLIEKGIICHESSLGYPPLPTTCGTDGSYAVEHLLTADLIAAAAVAVEGLTPPSEKRYWEQPHHISYIKSEVHHPDTATILRALMLGGELLLAEKAPHDLVMIDGTLTMPVIHFNQALNKAPETPELSCAKDFLDHTVAYLKAYSTILNNKRSDRNYVGLPKYSSRREIGKAMGWPVQHDDRGLLTILLRAGEFTKPLPLEQPEQPWHFSTVRLVTGMKKAVDEIAGEIICSLQNVYVFYYKPHDWLPTLRCEVAQNVAVNNHRLATVIQGIKHQCACAGMFEPYPLYLADRSVKALARAIPAFRQVTAQHISEKYEGDIGEIFFAMHGYRSESGA